MNTPEDKPDDPFEYNPIEFDEYVEQHLENNPGVNEETFRRRLRNAVEAKKSGKQCECGNLIWAAAAPVAGYSCFKCVTGETDASEDYEIKAVC